MKRQLIITKQHQEKGFTLVELSMSLIFVAFIILFLTSMMLSIMQTYNKGIWISQINQAGRQINADVIDQVRFSKNNATISNSQQRFCVGNITYLWNTVDSTMNQYAEETDLSTTKLRLVRILDSTGKYCYGSEMPSRNDPDIGALLGPGVVVQKFEVVSGVTGLLRIQAVFSAEGIKDDDHSDQPRYNAGIGRWQCGQVVEGVFKASKNQYCAFAEFDIITYRRLE
ncbi:type II secretion system GspH family protein [Candidatus Saccharibacteria bacterium]|nr:type II secretion system GspH family protein [Candidatus Saccharibacteria bacterium]